VNAQRLEKQDDLAALIVPTLVIARLGEADHHAWWGSNGASATGAFVLEDRFPRTRRILGLEIALVAAERRHLEEFGDHGEFVHLFSASLGAVLLARAWLAERKTESTDAELVELLHASSTSDLEALVSEPDELSDAVTFGERSRIGHVEAAQLSDPAACSVVVRRLAAAYLGVPGALPYLEIARTT